MRQTSKGLREGMYIRVRNAPSRRHAHGRLVSVIGDHVEYRSAYNNGVYRAPLANVAVDRKLQSRVDAK